MADWSKWVEENRSRLTINCELDESLSACSFNEGARIAKEETIKKACKWLENEYFNGKLREINGSWFVFESEFMQAMKGE